MTDLPHPTAEPAAPLTQAELAEIDRLEAKASPGPWRECGHEHGGCKCGLVWSIPAYAVVATTDTDCDEEGMSSTDQRKKDDAALIAALRNAWPRVATTLAAQAAERDTAVRLMAEERDAASGLHYAAWGERKRGNTYRARALALAKQSKVQRMARHVVEKATAKLIDLHRARSTAAQQRVGELERLLVDGADCFAFHTPGCLGDMPGHTCLCGYEKWQTDVAAARATPATPAAPGHGGASDEGETR